MCVCVCVCGGGGGGGGVTSMHTKITLMFLTYCHDFAVTGSYSDSRISNMNSGFCPGDSTIYQLISITSTIYEAFENYDETHAVFLDISKAFDKVWHEGIIFKLKCSGISGNLLNFF